MTKRGFSLFLLLIISCAFLHGQEIITAARYLEMVGNHYASLRDYEANIEIRTGTSTMTGNVSHRAPNLLRIDFSRPADQVIVFNGEALTVYLPEFRAVLNQPLARAGGGSTLGLSMLRRNYTAAYLTGPNPEPLDPGSSVRVIKLRLTRNTTAEGFREIILSIDPNTRLIRRMEGRTIADNEVRFDLTNIRTNVGIPDARFVYDTPSLATMYNNFLFRDND
ncbi:MAG: outer membrane lipoprotein carrier protein LolA [Treponema sp.]|nr:outer membrane lipoprotein carrier protein LolA [Treponema sp.]